MILMCRIDILQRARREPFDFVRRIRHKVDLLAPFFGPMHGKNPQSG